MRKLDELPRGFCKNSKISSFGYAGMYLVPLGKEIVWGNLFLTELLFYLGV